MDIYLNQKRIKINPKMVIGKGGEADIYDLKNGKVLKLFKPADHPDYQLLPQEQLAAKARIAIHQQKLPAFPTNLPVRVIKPEALATDKQGMILGYAMPFLQNTISLLKYSDRTYRNTNGLSQQFVTALKSMKSMSRLVILMILICWFLRTKSILLMQILSNSDSFPVKFLQRDLSIRSCAIATLISLFLPVHIIPIPIGMPLR